MVKKARRLGKKLPERGDKKGEKSVEKMLRGKRAERGEDNEVGEWREQCGWRREGIVERREKRGGEKRKEREGRRVKRR